MKFLEFDETRDFPFYNNIPNLSKGRWLALLLLIPVSILAYILIGYYSEIVGSFLFCMVMLIPLLYFSG